MDLRKTIIDSSRKESAVPAVAEKNAFTSNFKAHVSMSEDQRSRKQTADFLS